MTSPASAASTPSRRASTPPLRRAAKFVLILGTASSFGLAFGPNWATKIGIAVAVAAAIVGCMLAWRELWHVHRAHAHQVLEISKKHGKALSEERRHNAGVLELMSKRVKEYVIVVEGQKVTIALHSKDAVHDFTVQGGDTVVEVGGGKTKTGSFKLAKPGKYTFYCSVPGHEAAGMKGTLTVK